MKQMMQLSALAAMAVWAACGLAADPTPAKPAGVRVGQMLIFFECAVRSRLPFFVSASWHSVQ